MADEQKSGARAGSGKDDKPAKRKPAAKKPAEKKPAEKKPAKATPKQETKAAAKPRARKPAAAKAKAETKPAARRRPAAQKPASETKAPAEPKPAEGEPAQPARTSPRRAAPTRPLVRAQAKYVRSSARKARLVMDHVRGRPVAEARALLRHSPRGVARDVERLLNSAIANAENNHELVGDDLYVKEIYADEGPTLRRFRPRAQGRATRIRKRTSHLTVGLSTRE